MGTAAVKAIALPAVYRANLEFQSHVPSSICILIQGFTHARTPRVLHFSAFIPIINYCTSDFQNFYLLLVIFFTIILTNMCSPYP